MSVDRHCLDGGCVVSGEYPIPEDPAVYAHPAVTAGVGCSRLRCASCGAMVRHGPPGLVAKDDIRPLGAQLYDTPDWTTAPFLVQSTTPHRLYACRCIGWLENRIHATREPDFDPLMDVALPWACAGHPVPRLPITLSGETLSVGTAYDGLVGRILAGWWPEELAAMASPNASQRLIAMYAYLLGLPEAQAFAREVFARVDDPDPEVVGRVLWFFTKLPRAGGVDGLLERAGARVQRSTVTYSIPEVPLRGISLLDVVWARLADPGIPLDDGDHRARHALRAALLEPIGQLSQEEVGPTAADHYEGLLKQRDGGALSPAHITEMQVVRGMLAERRADPLRTLLGEAEAWRHFGDDDLQWLADHVDAIERSGPGRWQSVMNVLVARERANRDAGAFVVIAGMRLLQSGVVAPAELREWLEATEWAAEAWPLPLKVALQRREQEGEKA